MYPPSHHRGYIPEKGHPEEHMVDHHSSGGYHHPKEKYYENFEASKKYYEEKHLLIHAKKEIKEEGEADELRGKDEKNIQIKKEYEKPKEKKMEIVKIKNRQKEISKRPDDVNTLVTAQIRSGSRQAKFSYLSRFSGFDWKLLPPQSEHNENPASLHPHFKSLLNYRVHGFIYSHKTSQMEETVALPQLDPRKKYVKLEKVKKEKIQELVPIKKEEEELEEGEQKEEGEFDEEDEKMEMESLKPKIEKVEEEEEDDEGEFEYTEVNEQETEEKKIIKTEKFTQKIPIFESDEHSIENIGKFDKTKLPIKNLYVCNLPENITKENLMEKFNQFGKILEIYLSFKKMKNKVDNKEFVFYSIIQFQPILPSDDNLPTSNPVENSIKNFHQTSFHGNKIYLFSSFKEFKNQIKLLKNSNLDEVKELTGSSQSVNIHVHTPTLSSSTNSLSTSLSSSTSGIQSNYEPQQHTPSSSSHPHPTHTYYDHKNGIKISSSSHSHGYDVHPSSMDRHSMYPSSSSSHHSKYYHHPSSSSHHMKKERSYYESGWMGERSSSSRSSYYHPSSSSSSMMKGSLPPGGYYPNHPPSASAAHDSSHHPNEMGSDRISSSISSTSSLLNKFYENGTISKELIEDIYNKLLEQLDVPIREDVHADFIHPFLVNIIQKYQAKYPPKSDPSTTASIVIFLSYFLHFLSIFYLYRAENFFQYLIIKII